MKDNYIGSYLGFEKYQSTKGYYGILKANNGIEICRTIYFNTTEASLENTIMSITKKCYFNFKNAYDI